MNHASFASICVICALGIAASCAPKSPADAAAYFRVAAGEPSNAFVIKLTDKAKIAQARSIASGDETLRVHVQGTIKAASESYNPGWSFHLDPDTIDFFELAIEVCDAATSEVETHLDEVGGAFLPNGHWCPWESRVESEVSKGNE